MLDLEECFWEHFIFYTTFLFEGLYLGLHSCDPFLCCYHVRLARQSAEISPREVTR